MSFARSLDMYRKVPADLMEGTRRGSFFSICAVFTMISLFYYETRAFFTQTLVTDMTVDTNTERNLRINFNITMLDMSCDYAVVDVVSVLGTEQNVTQNVNKWQLDAAGVKKRFHGRNKKQKDIIMHDETVTETIEELHRNGEDALELDPTTFEYALKENTFLFVDFFASWCSHCIMLAPTWETLAEVMHEVASETLEQRLRAEYPDGNHGYTDAEFKAAAKLELPVTIAKVDCVKHTDFCRGQGIHAYPTLRLFVNGNKYGDYRNDRTVQKFTDYLATVEQDHLKKIGAVAEADQVAIYRLPENKRPVTNKVKRMKAEWKVEDHPGCQLSGFLMADRVPGNFHVKARSKSHDLVASMTNVSHEVHSLSFGDPSMIRMIERNKIAVPSELKDQLHPIDGYVYVNNEVHTAYHHHLKIVTTNYRYKDYRRNQAVGTSYQILAQSQLSRYGDGETPEAKFSYDLSPVAISYRYTSRKWYDYVTSIMALIGGSFTVVGMMESMVFALSRKKRL